MGGGAAADREDAAGHASRVAAGAAQAVLDSVKSVLAKHNIGRNTVEILPLVLPLALPQGPGPVHGSCSEEEAVVVRGVLGGGDRGHGGSANGGPAHAHAQGAASSSHKHDEHSHDGHSHAHAHSRGQGCVQGEGERHGHGHGHSPQGHGASFSSSAELV